MQAFWVKISKILTLLSKLPDNTRCPDIGIILNIWTPLLWPSNVATHFFGMNECDISLGLRPKGGNIQDLP